MKGFGSPFTPWYPWSEEEDAHYTERWGYERKAILHALRESKGDKLAAARLLRIGKSTFYRKLKTHGLS